MRQNIRVLIILMAAFALLSLQENKANNLEIIQNYFPEYKDEIQNWQNREKD